MSKKQYPAIPADSFVMVDGRKFLRPRDVPPGTSPGKIGAALARQYVSDFLRRGYAEHSPRGLSAWLLAAYCKEQGIPYRCVAHVVRGQGSRVAGWLSVRTDRELPTGMTIA